MKKRYEKFKNHFASGSFWAASIFLWDIIQHHNKLKNMENLAKNLFNEVLNGKTGNTFDFNGSTVTFNKGYFIGITGFQVPKIYFINPKYPINTLIHALNSIKPPEVFDFLGYWVENNTVYIDYVVYSEDKETSLNLAKVFNQKAIWDCKNNTEIYI